VAGEAGLEPATFGFGDRCSSQLSYSPAIDLSVLYFELPKKQPKRLLHLLVKGVLSTEFAEFFVLDLFCLLLLVPRCRVVPSLAFYALECDDISHRLTISFFLLSFGLLEAGQASDLGPYSRISVTVPAPTVRPPSRIANRCPFSMATLVIKLISKSTLSPGITISTPLGSFTVPVTSVV
jgi:hypothetical protein